MSDKTIQVTVQLLEGEYKIACTEDSRESLQAAANYLNTCMQDIRRGGKVLGIDRIAVMAAINISHELLDYRQQVTELGQFFDTRLRELLENIEAALSKSA
jgi:cell division protein ZapA